MIAFSRACMVAVGMITMRRRWERSFSPMRFPPMRFLPVRFPPVRFLPVRSLTMRFLPVRFLSVWMLPGRSRTFIFFIFFLRFHFAAELRVNLGNYLVCSHPCLAEDSLNHTLEAIAGVKVLFGEIHGHCLLFQRDLIFEILDKIHHPVQLVQLPFDVIVLKIYEVFIRGIFLIIGRF
jgi:hypothetical protein